MSQTNAIHCPSCNAVITKNFCANCGEKKRSLRDLSFSHYAEQTVEGISHFDGKFFRTIKLLFTKPGMLSLHFEQGRRVPYMKPFQLFIVVNLLFFLISRGTNLFALSLSSFYNHYTKYGTRPLIDSKLRAQTEEAFIEVGKVFNDKMVTQSKVFILLFIPVLGLAAAILFLRRKKYLSSHMVFATHFFSFVLIYFILFFLLIEAPVHFFLNGTDSDAFDAFVGISSISVFVIYLAIAAHRFYKTKWIWSILGSMGIAAVFLVALIGYRVMLFYKIINSM
jgi:hypothetical protein